MVVINVLNLMSKWFLSQAWLTHYISTTKKRFLLKMHDYCTVQDMKYGVVLAILTLLRY